MLSLYITCFYVDEYLTGNRVKLSLMSFRLYAFLNYFTSLDNTEDIYNNIGQSKE